MDGRAAFAVGGFIAGATAVAVACVVTMSNSVALADVPGVAVGVDVVRVTPSPGAKSSPTPSTPVKVAPATPAPIPSAEIVPAPEPQDVAAPVQVVPAAPVTAAAPVTPSPSSQTEEEIASDALARDSWDDLRSWAEARGWSQARIALWIASLKEGLPQSDDSAFRSSRSQTPADDAGSPSGSDASSSFGWKRDQSPQPPHGD